MVLRVRADMPTDRLPRGRGWRVATVGLVGLAVLLAVLTVMDGDHPTGYRAYHHPETWVYPTDAIVTWLGVMFAECFIACWVLQARVRVSLAARAVVLGGLMFVILVGLAPLAMHGGTPTTEHLIWLLFSSCWLVAIGLGSGIYDAVRRRRLEAEAEDL